MQDIDIRWLYADERRAAVMAFASEEAVISR